MPVFVCLHRCVSVSLCVSVSERKTLEREEIKCKSIMMPTVACPFDIGKVDVMQIKMKSTPDIDSNIQKKNMYINN